VRIRGMARQQLYSEVFSMSVARSVLFILLAAALPLSALACEGQ